MASHLRNVTIVSPGAPVLKDAEIVIGDDGFVAEIGQGLSTPEGAEVTDKVLEKIEEILDRRSLSNAGA